MQPNLELLNLIDSLKPEYLKIWENICNLESPTENKAAVDACGTYIVNWGIKHGWKVEIHEVEGAGDPICITLNPEAAGKPIVFSGHIDTVHPLGLFGYPPVKVDEENDVIYGPGVTDCKGGVVASMMAMDALERAGFTERPVMLLVQTDEEVSSRNSGKATINWICQKAAGAEAFLNMEGGSRGSACLIRKGISRYHFTVHGKGVHASNCDRGISALTEAAHKIIELEKCKDKDGITCSCGIIRGGTAENSVPEECFFTADFRFCNEKELEEADRIAKAVAATEYLPGTSCELKLASRRIAMPRYERNFELLDKMNAVYAAYGLPELAAKSSNGGSDAADASYAGIPTVDSVGTGGKGIHTQFESGRISSLTEAAKRAATVAYSI